MFEISPSDFPKFNCEYCDIKTNNKKDYNKHILTAKHRKNSNSNEFEPVRTEISQHHTCSKCSKKYTSKGGLWYHEKKCFSPKLGETVDYKELVNKLLMDNHELRNFIIDQTKEYARAAVESKKDSDNILNKVIELTQKNVNTINCNNNNNKSFNINLYLAEQCKDAINFSDFIKNIEVSHQDLENNAQLGFVNGISKIILDNLKQLSVNERPIHCTDLKRETMYIKDENKWTKEDNDAKLNSAIQAVSRKSIGKLMEWKGENDEYQDMDSKFSGLCIVIQRNSMAGYDRDVFYPKVIHAIAKEILVAK